MGRYVRANPGVTPRAVADGLDQDRASVRQTLRRMVEDGQLDTDGNGHYFTVTPVTASQQSHLSQVSQPSSEVEP
jgi:DNA-binding GntR family transcriptional regulator